MIIIIRMDCRCILTAEIFLKSIVVFLYNNINDIVAAHYYKVTMFIDRYKSDTERQL